MLPLIIAALVRHRVRVDFKAEEDPLIGFLYDSFTQDAPAWETLRLYRKALLCAVLMMDGLVTQSMVAIAIIATSMTLTAKFAPFRHKLVNSLEIMGQAVLVYVFCMSSAQFFSGNSGSSLQQTLGIVLALLIIIVIVGFIAAIVGVTACRSRAAVSPRQESDAKLVAGAKCANQSEMVEEEGLPSWASSRYVVFNQHWRGPEEVTQSKFDEEAHRSWASSLRARSVPSAHDVDME